MPAKFKSAIQYLAILGLTALLLWLSLRGLQTGDQKKSEFLWNAWKKSDKFFLLSMAAVTLLSHVLRAERWRMLLTPTGHKVNLSSSFLSLMIGYLVNLVIPRGGEISRSYYLYKLENTPVATSFGTVVVERMVDIICMLILIAISFFVEWEKLSKFIGEVAFDSTGSVIFAPWMVVALVLLASVGCLFFIFRKNEKFRKIFSAFKQGVLSVFLLKNKKLFIIYSLVIWLMYFCMTFLVIRAFDETTILGWSAVVTLFAIGSIAMAIPLPGGTGSYHTLVPLGLVMLYQMPQPEAIAFVFIFHAWQTLIMIVAGGLSLLTTYAIIRWRRPPVVKT